MTAREALKSLVDDLNDLDASAILAELEPRLVPDWRKRTLPPNWAELAAMTAEERDEAFLRWPPEIDMEEFKAWEAIDLDELSRADA